MPFWTADSDLDTFIILDSSVNSRFKCLHLLFWSSPCSRFLWMWGLCLCGARLNSLWSCTGVRIGWGTLMYWLGLDAKAHYEKHFLARDSLSESPEVSFYSGISTKANIGCLFKPRTWKPVCPGSVFGLCGAWAFVLSTFCQCRWEDLASTEEARVTQCAGGGCTGLNLLNTMGTFWI